MNWKTSRLSLLELEEQINDYCADETLPVDYTARLQAHVLEQVRAKIVNSLATAWRKKKDTVTLKLLPIEMEVMVRCIEGSGMDSEYLLLQMGSKI